MGMSTGLAETCGYPDRKTQNTVSMWQGGTVLRFLLFIPALTYAVLNYYVLILSYILALIASSLLDDIL